MTTLSPSLNRVLADLDTAVDDKKVQKFNLVEVKVLLDEALKKTLDEGLGFKEDRTYENFKLGTGYIACIIACGASAYNYFVPFEKCKMIVATSVIVYSILCGILTWFSFRVEKGVVFVGQKANSKKRLLVTTELKNYDPAYHTFMRWKENGQDDSTQKLHFEQSIGSWIDEDGNFVPKTFIRDIVKWMDKKHSE